MAEVPEPKSTLEQLVNAQKPWDNGEVLELPDLAAFRDLEDTFSNYVPCAGRDMIRWLGRKNIEDLVRPKKFFGRIANITLVYVSEPNDYAAENDFSFGPGTTRGLCFKDQNEITKQYMFGFTFLSELHSTGKGSIGTLRSFLAYAPPQLQDNFLGRSFTIRRVVSKPTIEAGVSLEELRAKSIKTALRVRANKAAYPYGGMSK
jgi:hypothetical protein